MMFHIHKWGKWHFRSDYRLTQIRECETCGKVKMRLV